MLERVEALRLTGSKPPRYPYGYASSSSGTLVLESEVLNNREGDAFDAVKKAYDGIRSMRVALLDEDGQGKRKAAVEFAFASEEMRSCALEKPVYFEKCDCVWPMPTFPAKPICLLIDIVGLPLEDDENVAREKIMKSVPTLFVHWPAQNINPNVLDTVPGKLPSSGIYNGNMAVVLEGAPEIPKKALQRNKLYVKDYGGYFSFTREEFYVYCSLRRTFDSHKAKDCLSIHQPLRTK